MPAWRIKTNTSITQGNQFFWVIYDVDNYNYTVMVQLTLIYKRDEITPITSWLYIMKQGSYNY